MNSSRASAKKVIDHKISLVYLLTATFCLAATALAATGYPNADHINESSTPEPRSYSYSNDSIIKSSDNLSSESNATVVPKILEMNESKSNNPKKADVATYVYNDDDDSLDVSLYIDSVPKGKATVSKGEQETFGNYSLTLGIHRFKIVWEDPSPKKIYESDQNKEIKGDDAITLYTTEHRELEKYDLTVSVKNENDKKTTAYLYIDGIYQSDKEISEDSSDDFSSVSAEEGVHDISLKWLDPHTNDEYEKKKRITIEGGSNIVFVVSKGSSFEDKGEATETTSDTTEEINSVSTSHFETEKSLEVANVPRDNTANKEISISSNYSLTNGLISNSTDNAGINNTDVHIIAENNNSDAKNSDKTANLYAVRTLSAKESPITENKKSKDAGWENISLIYPLALLAAAYFVFRH